VTSIVVTLVVVVVLVAVLATVSRRFNRARGEPDRFPFEQCRPLSDREQVLYWRLRQVMHDQIVLSQVGMSRILRVQKGHDVRAWLNRINRMTVDFLVCLPDATIVAAIELDDASHDVEDRVRADAKKAKALESAGIKLLRFRDLPSEQELRDAFLK
jgi:very-short-patch-repair endonuclease